MAFRADESTRAGFEEVISYLVPRANDASKEERAKSKEVLINISEELGPVVDTYPSWHPLVCNSDASNPQNYPNDRCGYEGLDHTRYFARGFITCPYPHATNKILDSVSRLPKHIAANIQGRRLDAILYNSMVTPILVKCEWERPMLADGTIPLSLVMPLILEKEVPCWRTAEVAETWETMRPYFLGRPCGSRSSLFVNQETGQGIKKIWEALIHTGMFGPIKI